MQMYVNGGKERMERIGMMERIQSAKDSCCQGSGRVTTDAVHRRFLSRKKTKATCAENERSEEDYYYCNQCNLKITAVPEKEELKFHFESIKHKPFASCVYCSKPVYSYRHKKKLEVFHTCTYD